ETRDATNPVAAHLRFASVRVEDGQGDIRFAIGRRFEHEQAVGADAEPARTPALRELGERKTFARDVVEQDEVVAGPLSFGDGECAHCGGGGAWGGVRL